MQNQYVAMVFTILGIACLALLFWLGFRYFFGKVDAKLTQKMRREQAGNIEIKPQEDGLWLLEPTRSSILKWNDFQRIVAVRHATLGGDYVGLIAELSGQRVVQFYDFMRGWDALIENLPGHLPGALPHLDWMLKLVASGPPSYEAVEVYRPNQPPQSVIHPNDMLSQDAP